jgi:Uma2 family endonuclease
MEFTVTNKKATIEDYKKLPEGASFELIEGHLIKEPSPEYLHQKASMNLSSAIHQYVKAQDLGEVLAAPMDVYLDEENIFQPDILFIAKENFSLIEKDGIHGPTDIVIEILSSYNAYNDFSTKLRIYEKYGVREYFIVDPSSKDVTRYSLEKGKYHEVFRESGVIISKVLKQEFHF